MKISEAITFFSSLSETEQQKFLALFSHWLTILARDTYEIGTQNITNSPKIRRINEIQHQISSHLLALLENNKERYPDEVLLKIILENTEDEAFESEMLWVFEQTANRFLVAV
jgi:hypothetical protein